MPRRGYEIIRPGLRDETPRHQFGDGTARHVMKKHPHLAGGFSAWPNLSIARRVAAGATLEPHSTRRLDGGRNPERGRPAIVNYECVTGGT